MRVDEQKTRMRRERRIPVEFQMFDFRECLQDEKKEIRSRHHHMPVSIAEFARDRYWQDVIFESLNQREFI